MHFECKTLSKLYCCFQNFETSRLFVWVGYGCWSTGNITEEMVNEYLGHHRNESSLEDDDFILE